MTPSRFNVSPEWGLVMVTALWGSSFILLSLSLKGLSPGLLVALRFGGGAVLMACLLRSALFKLKKEDWIAGCATGTCIFLGYFLQTVGLQTITSSISAFLTALYVPFVPLFQWILFRKRPTPIIAGGILFAFIGMLFDFGSHQNLPFTAASENGSRLPARLPAQWKFWFSDTSPIPATQRLSVLLSLLPSRFGARFTASDLKTSALIRRRLPVSAWLF